MVRIYHSPVWTSPSQVSPKTHLFLLTLSLCQQRYELRPRGVELQPRQPQRGWPAAAAREDAGQGGAVPGAREGVCPRCVRANLRRVCVPDVLYSGGREVIPLKVWFEYLMAFLKLQSVFCEWMYKSCGPIHRAFLGIDIFHLPIKWNTGCK